MLLRILCSVVMFIGSAAVAGEWHVPGSLQCADCHLQHGTDPNAPGFVGPNTTLLRKNSVNELCLSCHDGTDVTAPDVLGPVAMYNSTVTKESAGGFFTLAGIDNPAGHTLGLPVTAPLGASSVPVELNCTSCHAPHGNQNYRNLITDPAGTGAEINVQNGVNVFFKQGPSIPPTSNGSSIAYSRDNIAYGKGMASWCSSCHDLLANNVTGAYPSHFNSHPSDLAMNESGATSHIDITHWLAGDGNGFDMGQATFGIPRVPFQSPNATDFTGASTSEPTNEVSCVSCHKAHGSTFNKDLIWPYLDGGNSHLAGCQQCHNK